MFLVLPSGCGWRCRHRFFCPCFVSVRWELLGGEMGGLGAGEGGKVGAHVGRGRMVDVMSGDMASPLRGTPRPSSACGAGAAAGARAFAGGPPWPPAPLGGQGRGGQTWVAGAIPFPPPPRSPRCFARVLGLLHCRALWTSTWASPRRWCRRLASPWRPAGISWSGQRHRRAAQRPRALHRHLRALFLCSTWYPKAAAIGSDALRTAPRTMHPPTSQHWPTRWGMIPHTNTRQKHGQNVSHKTAVTPPPWPQHPPQD